MMDKFGCHGIRQGQVSLQTIGRRYGYQASLGSLFYPGA
jgi:hypothetical protein